MKTLKFSEDDRKQVIAAVSAHLSTKLTRIGSSRKFLEDPAGKPYLVLGGYDTWHGIPTEDLHEAKRRNKGGVLVIAKRWQTTIEVFVGDLQPMIDNERKLSHATSGNQFTVSIRGNLMSVKAIDSFYLHKMGDALDVGFPVLQALKKMSESERKQLLQAVRAKSENS